MKSILKYFSLSCSLLIVYAVILYVFNGNHQWGSLFVLISVFFISYFYFYKNPQKRLFISFSIIVLPFILFFCLILLFGASFNISVYIFFTPLSFYFGWLFYKLRKKSIIILGLFVASFAAFIYLPNLLNYRLNYKALQTKSMPTITLLSYNQLPVFLPKDKVIVLDFWTTSCAVCFKKFPEYEELYLKYKDDANIEFYSVNVPLKRDSFPETIKLVNKLGYKYSTIYAASRDETEEKLNIEAYPDFIIVKNDSIRYKGYLNIGKNILVYNTINELEKILNE